MIMPEYLLVPVRSDSRCAFKRIQRRESSARLRTGLLLRRYVFFSLLFSSFVLLLTGPRNWCRRASSWCTQSSQKRVFLVKSSFDMDHRAACLPEIKQLVSMKTKSEYICEAAVALEVCETDV